jgi:hypothetical protein
VLKPDSTFLLEYANKQNVKAILRYLLRRQTWNPFSPEPVEYLPLNFDFHPKAVRRWLADSGFQLRRQVTVSHFRIGFLKRTVPPRLLSGLDSLAGYTGDWIQFSPSVFVLARTGAQPADVGTGMFRCPNCGNAELQEAGSPGEASVTCRQCRRRYLIQNGIYNFKEPRSV